MKNLSNFWLIETISPELVQSMLDEIEAADLWLYDTRRQQLLEQTETQTIPLRGAFRPAGSTARSRDLPDSQDVLIDRFPICGGWLRDFAVRHSTTLGHAMIVRLQSGGSVKLHYDAGDYYRGKPRVHLVLQSTGSLMTCGDEAAIYQPGDVFWFDNQLPHMAFNDSNDWRVHVIFDLESDIFKRPALRPSAA
jgi:hypothetical protein